MKSDRRHELHQNMLAQGLSVIGQWTKKYANYLAGALLVVAIIVLAYTWYSRSSSQQRQDTITDFQKLHAKLGQSNDDATLKLLSELGMQTTDVQVAARANLDVGNAYALRIVRTTDLSDSERNTFIQEAGKHYQRLDQYAQFPQLQAQAHIGLARLAETQRNFDLALQEYAKAARLAPKGTYEFTAAQQGPDEVKQLRGEAPVQFATTAPAPKVVTPASRPAATTGQAPKAAPAASQPATAKTVGKASASQPTRRPVSAPAK